MMKEKMALSIDDIRAIKIGPNSSESEIYAEALRVVTEKLERTREAKYDVEDRRINAVLVQEEMVERIRRLMRENILKQTAVEEEDQVESFESPQRNCGFKRKQSLEEEEETMELKKKRNMPISKKGMPTGPQPNLPEEFKNHIAENGGSKEMLVIQKKLYATDVKPGQSRLSIPISQIKNEFLTEKEKEMLNSRKEKDKKHCYEIEVPLIDPSLNRQNIYLKKWKMNKSSIYALGKSWNTVVKNNKLKENNVVQLWSFRVGTELRFALVKS